MLPHSESIVHRLGIDWGKGNLHKGGAEFIDEEKEKSIYFPLSDKYKTYQIERSGFDMLLFENAADKGVETHQREKVIRVESAISPVVVETDKTAYRCRYFIDATGRSALMGRGLRSIKRLENLGRFALYSHYRNVTTPAADSLFETGNVVVLTVDIGWIWVIPLIGRRLSIGLVIQNQGVRSNAGLFQRYIGQSRLLQRVLSGAEQENAIRAEADFSFVNRGRHGQRYATCGDASGFLDPVFSSGVFLAFTSAERIADRLHEALVGEFEDDPCLHCVDDERYESGFRTMQLIVERFYQSDLVSNLFFEADRDERIKREVGKILAGDLWSESNAFQKGLLEGRRARV